MIMTVIVWSILFCITLFYCSKAIVHGNENFESAMRQCEYIDELQKTIRENELKYTNIISLEHNEKMKLYQVIDELRCSQNTHNAICPLLKKERIAERQKKIDTLTKEIIAIEKEA